MSSFTGLVATLKEIERLTNAPLVVGGRRVLAIVVEIEEYGASLTLEQSLSALHDAKQDGVQIGLLLEQIVQDFDERTISFAFVHVKIK